MYGGNENSNLQKTFIGGGGNIGVQQTEPSPPPQTHTDTHINNVSQTPTAEQLQSQKDKDNNTRKKINNIIGDKHNTIGAKISSGIKSGEQLAQGKRFLMVFPAFKVLFLIIFLIFFYRRIIDLVTFFDVSDIHADFYITWVTFLLILWVILPANRSIIL